MRSPFDKQHQVIVTLDYHDWKKLTRASITQKRSLKSLLDAAIHESVKNLDRMGFRK